MCLELLLGTQAFSKFAKSSNSKQKRISKTKTIVVFPPFLFSSNEKEFMWDSREWQQSFGKWRVR